MRLIIHLNDCDKQESIQRVAWLLPEYYRLKGEDDRRLTVMCNGDVMTIYHDQKDVVIFGFDDGDKVQA